MVAGTSPVAVVFTLPLAVGRKAVAAAAVAADRQPSERVALARAFATAPGCTIQKAMDRVMHDAFLCVARLLPLRRVPIGVSWSPVRQWGVR